MNANLYALFESHFPASAQPCLVVPAGPAIDYDELAAWSARIAHALVELGCAPGDRVAVQTDKVWQNVPLYLACLRAGLAYLPLNPAYRKDELARLFEDAKPRVAVCSPAMLGVTATLAGNAHVLTLDAQGGELIDRAQAEPDRFDTVHSQADDLAAVVYTSGTTGRAKGAMLSHRNLASNAAALVAAWGYTRGDVLLHALPVFHVHGLFVAIHCTLLAGARMLWLPRFDAADVVAHLPHCSVMMGVPTYYTRMLADPSLTRERCAGVRLFVSGSAPLLPETFAAFRERTGHAILERYGMTETGMIASNPLDGARVAGTVGRPLAGVDVRLFDGDAVVLPGKVGQVQVRGPNVFTGYWNLPDRTREEFTPDGWFRTGDVGEWVDGGAADGYLRLVGRAKDLIITGGLNVYPKEVEDRLDRLPGVEESAVIGLPDADFGEAVVAVIVARCGADLTERAVLDALRGEFASFKIPKRVYVVTALPRNAMGKVQKNVLRATYAPSPG